MNLLEAAKLTFCLRHFYEWSSLKFAVNFRLDHRLLAVTGISKTLLDRLMTA